MKFQETVGGFKVFDGFGCRVGTIESEGYFRPVYSSKAKHGATTSTELQAIVDFMDNLPQDND